MKKAISLIVVCMLLFVLGGCGNKKDVESVANEAVDIFSSGNMEAINQLDGRF